jgi:hypothetical protein
MLNLKLYQQKDRKYKPKECQSIKKGMDELKPLAVAISRHYAGHLVTIRTKTWQGIPIATSSRYPITTESILTCGQIPPTHFRLEKKVERSHKYRAAFVEKMFPITVCLC